jgi:anti-sigma-K factor RskA
MENQHNQPDAAIDKTLAALNSAAPPEGLDSRIAARIAAQPAPAVSPWRDRLTGYTLASAWWRGALTGAVAAMLALTAVLLLQHHSQAPRRAVLYQCPPHLSLR